MDKELQAKDFETNFHLSGSFLPQPLLSDDWYYCCHQANQYPAPPPGPSLTDVPSSFESSEGMPCLVPSSLMPHSPDAGEAHNRSASRESLWPDGDKNGYNIGHDTSPMMYSEGFGHHPHVHPAYFSPVACVPCFNKTPVAEEFWSPGNVQCVPGSQPPLPNIGADSLAEESDPGNKLKNIHNTSGRGNLRCSQNTCTETNITVQDFSGGRSSFTNKCISDPNILPLVDLTKSEMEIFTVQDFKEQKLEYFQKKTQNEKSTVLVVCIDHGMCAAFHLPQDDSQGEKHDLLKEKAADFMNGKGSKEYLSVKKSLDTVFPSTLANAPTTPMSLDENVFLNAPKGKGENESDISATLYPNEAINRHVYDQEEAVQNLPGYSVFSDSE